MRFLGTNPSPPALSLGSVYESPSVQIIELGCWMLKDGWLLAIVVGLVAGWRVWRGGGVEWRLGEGGGEGGGFGDCGRMEFVGGLEVCWVGEGGMRGRCGGRMRGVRCSWEGQWSLCTGLWGCEG